MDGPIDIVNQVDCVESSLYGKQAWTAGGRGEGISEKVFKSNRFHLTRYTSCSCSCFFFARQAVGLHQKMVKEYSGVPGVVPERVAEGMAVRSVAISPYKFITAPGGMALV